MNPSIKNLHDSRFWLSLCWTLRSCWERAQEESHEADETSWADQAVLVASGTFCAQLCPVMTYSSTSWVTVTALPYSSIFTVYPSPSHTLNGVSGHQNREIRCRTDPMLSVPCLTHPSVDVSGKMVEALDVSGGGLEMVLHIKEPRGFAAVYMRSPGWKSKWHKDMKSLRPLRWEKAMNPPWILATVHIINVGI